MRMLRSMCGVTKKDKIRNEHVRGSVKVSPMTKKIREKRLKWYGHDKRRDKGHVLRSVFDAPIPEKIRRGRQKNQVERLVEKRYGKCRVKARRKTHWIRQSGRMIFNTNPATPDDGKRLRTMLLKVQHDKERHDIYIPPVGLAVRVDLCAAGSRAP